MCKSKCTYIIGFDFKNDEIRNLFEDYITNELNGQWANQSCFTIKSNTNISLIKSQIRTKIKELNYIYQEGDFVKIYYSALQGNAKCADNDRYMIYEHSIELDKL